MTTISINEVQTRLVELLEGLASGEELLITKDNQPLARVVGCQRNLGHRELGTMKGTVKYMADDFDKPLNDFKEYME